MTRAHPNSDLRRFQGGDEARLLYAVDVDAENRVVFFPEATSQEDRHQFRAYTFASLRCILPGCRARLVANFRTSKRDGFSHYGGAGGHAAESLWHEQSKHLIANWASRKYPKTAVELERASADGRRRPDLTITGTSGSIAIEVQYSPLGVDEWRRRHADLARHYLSQTWLLGHAGVHFKVTARGSLRFSALVATMLEAGCTPMWLNPETGELLTAWTKFDAHGPEIVSSEPASYWNVALLEECTLTADGLRTPALDALAVACRRREASEQERRAAEAERQRARQQRWECSATRSWVVHRDGGLIPEFVTAVAEADVALAEKLDISPEHWKAEIYRRITESELGEPVSFKEIVTTVTRGRYRDLHPSDFTHIAGFLRLLEAEERVALRLDYRRRVVSAHPRSPASARHTDVSLAVETKADPVGVEPETHAASEMASNSNVAPTVDPRAAERLDVALWWLTDTGELRRLVTKPPVEQTLTKRLIARASQTLTARRRTRRIREIEDRRLLAESRLERLFVGADPRQWGVLSGAGSEGQHRVVRLEDTLRHMESIPWLQEQCAMLLGAIPTIRALAESGRDPTGVDAIERGVLNLLDGGRLSVGDHRRLTEHLPGYRRPVPGSLEELDRHDYPIALSVSRLDTYQTGQARTESPLIRLHDIVVSRPLRGRGLGTAALVELCRFADLSGEVIEGELEPGPHGSAAEASALARWYARHGFEQDGRPARNWARGGTIRRTPK